MEARASGQESGRWNANKELPVDGRRRSERARDGGPQGPGWTESPVPPGAGLDLEAGVVVVLELGAEGHVQPVGHERDLVLHEPGEPLSCNMRRQELDDCTVDDAIVDEAVAERPTQVVPLGPLGAVPDIDVIRG